MIYCDYLIYLRNSKWSLFKSTFQAITKWCTFTIYFNFSLNFMHILLQLLTTWFAFKNLLYTWNCLPNLTKSWTKLTMFNSKIDLIATKSTNDNFLYVLFILCLFPFNYTYITHTHILQTPHSTYTHTPIPLPLSLSRYLVLAVSLSLSLCISRYIALPPTWYLSC